MILRIERVIDARARGPDLEKLAEEARKGGYFVELKYKHHHRGYRVCDMLVILDEEEYRADSTNEWKGETSQG